MKIRLICIILNEHDIKTIRLRMVNWNYTIRSARVDRPKFDDRKRIELQNVAITKDFNARVTVQSSCFGM